MTGTGLLGLVLLSMAWLLFLAGLALKLRPLSGIAGSVAMFFTLPVLAKYGIEVPWPWLWILLPLVLLVRKR
jgi:hypothetical protein